MTTEASNTTQPLVLPLAPQPVPLSPEQQARNQRFATRIWCGFMTAASAAMLGLARFYLTPSPTGFETHTQLGLPPCGFFRITRIPCPTCGCTTAVTHVAHGNFLQAIVTQPFGAAVGFLALILLALGPIGIITGKWLGPEPFKLSFFWQRIVFGALGLLIGAWGYNIVMVCFHLR